MMKMVLLFTPLFILSSHILNVAGQERLQILTLHHDSTPFTLQNVLPLGVGVSLKQENLYEVSSTILMAEKWVRAHVLSHYPSTNVSTIVVEGEGPDLLCSKLEEEERDGDISRLLLPSMKNIHHTLTRWGLNREIKVSVSLYSNCIHGDFTQTHINPILSFLREINSSYSLYPLHKTLDLGDFHSIPMRKLGFVHINLIINPFSKSKQTKTASRKLSFVEGMPSNLAPTPSYNPSHNGGSLPPLIGISSPEVPPASPPPYNFNLPPCSGGGVAAGPVVGVHEERLWCVAKPSVPWDKLQVGMDYACGEGGGDCEAIEARGSCYYPDSVVAHASYAFNSYWQKSKKVGATCGFGGTAMLINSDPSYLHCRFIFS